MVTPSSSPPNISLITPLSKHVVDGEVGSSQVAVEMDASQELTSDVDSRTRGSLKRMYAKVE